MLARRLPAVVLPLALLAGNVGVCAGWATTAEARMACCSEGGACPMHTSDTKNASDRVITQAQADSCCASSEQDDSTQSSPNVAVHFSSAVLGTGIILPVSVPALVLSDSWRAVVPIPSRPVPKHLLLSVLLV
jgi:hypothetical protein